MFFTFFLGGGGGGGVIADVADVVKKNQAVLTSEQISGIHIGQKSYNCGK